jgi:membrane protease YdiL (CAAX protease family)
LTYVTFLSVLYWTAVIVIAGYLSFSNRGLEYLDVRVPTLRDTGYVGGGVVLDFVLAVLLSLVLSALAAPTPPTTIFEQIEMTNPDNVLVFIPFALAVNGPVEEVLFRGLIQRRLYNSYSQGIAVIVASLLFAFFHLPVFYAVLLNPSPPLLGITVALLFWYEGGLVYERTGNLVVPALVHGIINAAVSLFIYLSVG